MRTWKLKAGPVTQIHKEEMMMQVLGKKRKDRYNPLAGRKIRLHTKCDSDIPLELREKIKDLINGYKGGP